MNGSDYAISGAFGQVRLCRSCLRREDIPLPFAFSSGGWHRCGELYRVARPHGAEYYLLFFSLTEGGRLRIGERSFEIPASSVAILPPGIPHEYYTAQGKWWEFYWLHLGRENGELFQHLIRDFGYVFSLPRVNQMGSLMENLFPERFTANDAVYEIAASQTVSQMLHLLLEDAYTGMARTGPKGGTVQRIIARLEKDYPNKISMRSLAREHFLSEQHMIRLFRAATGCTPYEYLKKYRLRKAGELLSYTDLSLGEIAAMTGFSGVNNFICQFRRSFGCPPGAYRKLHR